MPQVRDEGIEILRALTGSRAYGLHDSTSDYDYHSVYVIPTSRLLSLGPKLKETKWIEGEEQDHTGWELRHFLEMAVNCNPTVLETLVAPVELINSAGQDLCNLMPSMLSRKRIYDAFRGYAKNQRTKMFDPGGGWREDRIAKAAIAYLRSLYHGEELLRTGTYDPKISEGYLKQALIHMKSALSVQRGDVVTLAEELEDKLTDAYINSKIPNEPDIESVNKFLLDVRFNQRYM